MPEDGRITLGAEASGSIDKDSDQHALQSYLGRMEAAVVSATRKQREELLALAREKRFADQFGRHRSLQARQLTPPGMWDTDMPDTQHLEEYRQATKTAEDKRIMDRRREARSGHGRWKFRDGQ